MRINIILDTFPSLSETFLYTTIRNLQQAGVEVKVLARKRGKAVHQVSFQAVVRYLPSEDLPFVVKSLLVVYYALRLLLVSPDRLGRALKQLRAGPGSLRQRSVIAFRILPLLCQSGTLTYFPFGGLAVKYLEYIQLEPHTVFSLRGSDINISPLVDRGYRQRLKEALLSAGGVHCVCEDIRGKAETLAEEPLPRARVIYTAIGPQFLEAQARPAVQNDKLRLVSVGRLDWRKGLEHGMMAARALAERGYDFEWQIIGEGEYRIPLQWVIRDMELQERVQLTGAKTHDEIRSHLLNAQIYFHPTVHEGISNAVLEAMALGLPVVASDVGGMREAVTSGENGLLVPPRDWRAMAEALESLFMDPKLRLRLGEKARESVLAKFTPDQQVAGFTALFEDTIKV